MAWDGEPDEVAANFKTHAVEALGKVLLKQSKNPEKDMQECLHCFEQALEAKPTDKKLRFQIYSGQAKCNMLRA